MQRFWAHRISFGSTRCWRQWPSLLDCALFLYYVLIVVTMLFIASNIPFDVLRALFISYFFILLQYSFFSRSLTTMKQEKYSEESREKYERKTYTHTRMWGTHAGPKRCPAEEKKMGMASTPLFYEMLNFDFMPREQPWATTSNKEKVEKEPKTNICAVIYSSFWCGF